MTKEPIRPRVTAEDGGDMIHLYLTRESALLLAHVIGVKGPVRVPKKWSRVAGEQLRGIGMQIVKLTRPAAPPIQPFPRYGVTRPSSRYPSEIDRDHVVSGSPPYPVLCRYDMYEAYLVLEKKGLSAPEIAERLYVEERTVYRWRKNGLPKWKETEDDSEHEAG